MKVIVVTGTPGTGKTTVAKKIAKQKRFLYIDVKKLIKNFKLNENFDKKRQSWIIDIDSLNKLLIAIIQSVKDTKGIVIDSHLAHYLPSKYVDECIITTTDRKKLYSRLKKRKYSKAKIDENMEVEIMQIIPEEARKLKHKIKIVTT